MRAMLRLVVLLLACLALGAGATRGEEAPLVVVCLGDSITKGVRAGVTADQIYSQQFEQDLRSKKLNVRVINQGVGGETTAGALQRLDRDVLAHHPALVTLMYGTNDCYVDAGQQRSRLSIDEYRQNLEQLIARIRAAGAEPILMTPPAYASQSPANGLGEHGNVRLKEYAAACRAAAERRDVPLVDHFQKWHDALSRGEALEGWTTDGYHPNTIGHSGIAESMQVAETAIRDLLAGPVDFDVRVEEVLSHDDGKSLWYHPRATINLSSITGDPGYLMTLQKHLMADDHYGGLAVTRPNNDGGWAAPEPVPALAWRKNKAGETIAVCDVTPGYHPPSGKVLALGAKILYDDAGKQLTSTRHAHQVAYAIYNGRDWSEWKLLELPDDDKYFLATPGCAQWIVEPDGTILLPIYHQGPTGEVYAATVLRCGFDGQEMKLLEQGTTLELAEVRGLCEPSITRFRGRYHLTLRNDLKGYVTTSDDGLHYAPITPWLFDDGQELGSYNTQQHWITHSGGLFLVYTRRGADNDHIVRHRAPLFMARIDTGALRVLRATEKIVIPERGGELGNFGANAASENEAWVTVGEGVWNDDARRRGAKGTVFIGHIQWSRPDRLRAGWFDS
ncbi:MAG: hypothetical protein K1X71_19940 [Pirellulales bacterium]|nr:hypothetical protein [Pirellulales bacterium]